MPLRRVVFASARAHARLLTREVEPIAAVPRLYTIYFIAQSRLAESLFYFLPASPRDGGPLVANARVVFSERLASLGGGARWSEATQFPTGSERRDPAAASILGLLPGADDGLLRLEIVLISRARHAAAALTYGSSTS